MIPSLNYAVLTDALHALKEGNIRHCESLGFTYNELEAINNLSVDELFILSRASVWGGDRFCTVKNLGKNAGKADE